MFCNYCAAVNPADSFFCSACGKSIRLSDPVSAVVDRDATPARDDTPSPTSQPLPNDQPKHAAVDALSPAQVVAPRSQTATIGRAQTTNAPYATFTVSYLAGILSSSCAIFAIAYGLADNEFGDDATVFLVVSLLAASLLLVASGRSWRRIVAIEAPDGVALKQRRRRVLVKAVLFALFFGTISAAIGYAIGQNQAEAARIKADLAEMRETGHRISKARTPNGSATIDWYVQMYKSIEPSVDHLEAVLRRLVTEYPSYGAKFPQSASSVSSTVSDFNVGIQRMNLLKKQIDVAKRIEGQDEDLQRLVWRSDMIPLLEQEDALDKSK